jgi:GntP family gluconate:H+ symporter
MSHDTLLLVAPAVGILLLIVLIVYFKLHPFIALVSISIALALVAGMSCLEVVKSFEEGMGKTLGHIALVIALGAMLGKMMAESGGAEIIAKTMIGWFGISRIPWAMVSIALIVGIPVFFEVGFVLLIPIAFTVAKRTGTPMALIGLPMAAGLSVVHGLIPPHPAALLAVTAYHADMGKTILYGLLVGVPTAIIAGPLYATWISRYVVIDSNNPLMKQFTEEEEGKPLPGFAITVATILLPVVLMLLGSWADVFSPKGSVVNDTMRLCGTSVMALLIAVLISFWTLGAHRGMNRATILKYTNDCLGPTAASTLLIGAGGGFGRILADTGISKILIASTSSWQPPDLVMGWLVSVLVRLATGSATVAMTTTCGIMAPMVAAHHANAELMVLATGAGSLFFSHVNDGGFWMVKEFLNMTVVQTFKTWSVLETIISVVGLALTLVLAQLV